MSKSKSNFRGTVTQDLREHERESKSGYLNLPDNIKLLMLPEKTLQIRMDFLPYIVTSERHPDRNDKLNKALPGNQWWKFPIKIHRNVGVSNTTILCPTTVGERCPICEYVAKHSKTLTKDEYTAISAKSRVLYIVIPLGNDKLDEVPYVWDISEHLFQKILKTELEIDERNEIFPDLDEGKTLEIKFIWESMGGKNDKPFPKARNISFLDREPYTEKALEIIRLDEVLKVLSYDEIHERFWATDAEDPAEEIVETTEAETGSTVRPSASSLRKTDIGGTSPAPETKEQENAPAATTHRVPRSKQTPPAEASTDDNKDNPCPYGHVFGVEIAQFPECDQCPKWDDCDQEGLKLQKQK